MQASRPGRARRGARRGQARPVAPMTTPNMRHDTAHRACDTAQGALGLASRACHDTILCIMTRGAGLASRHSALGAVIGAQRLTTQHSGAATRASARVTWHTIGARVAIQFLYRDQRELRHGVPVRAYGQLHGRAWPRHGRA